MNSERDAHDDRITHSGSAEPPVGAWVPLPEDSTPGADRSRRSDGDTYRRARRRSRLTAGVLMVGSGAAAVTLAYNLIPPATPAGGGASSTGAGVGTTTVTNTGTGPTVTHTVATTSASGVTTYTTTQVVNGKTVVTHVQKASTSTYHDD
ncbi:MAG: hypothetical protein WB797_18925 [Nocardioides sp.]